MFINGKRLRIGIPAVLMIALALVAFSCASAPMKPGAEKPVMEKSALTLTPDKGKAAAALKIEGKGFKPGEEVDVIIILGEGLRVGLGTAKVDVIVADQSGAFEAQSAVPMNAKPGEYRIDAIGSKGSEAAAVLQVLPKE